MRRFPRLFKLQKSGREVEVTGSYCKNGIKALTFSEPRGPEYHYDPPTDDYIGGQPTLGTKWIYFASKLD